MRNKIALRVALFCLIALGLISIFGPLLHFATIEMERHHHAFGRTNVIISLPVVGVLLLYIAVFVYYRRLLAVYLSAGLSIALSAYQYTLLGMTPLTLATILLTALFIGACATCSNYFTIRNSFEGLRQQLKPIGIIMMIGFAYGVAGFLILGERFFHTSISFEDAAILTISNVIGLNGTITEQTHVSQLFIDSLGGIGIIIFISLLGALFRPLRLKLFVTGQHDLDLAERILQESSTSSEDFFKLWPRDKRYFFSEDKRAFIAYKQAGHTIVVLGEPAGDHHAWPQLIEQFTEYCQSLGWALAVVNANRQTRKLYKSCGFSSLFIGNEAVVDVAQFIDTTRRDKHFRYVANKAHRDNLAIEEWVRPNRTHIEELREVSDDWLARGGRREYTFFMGYFDPAYLQQCRVFVLKQAGQTIAFVNLIPTFIGIHASIDMFRSRADASPVATHFLLMSVLETLSHEQVKTLNLGLSPLSGVTDDQETTSRALLRAVRFLGASYYAFQGLEQFKSKFRPTWEKRWLLVSGTSASIIRASRDIEAASRYEPHGDRQIYISTVVGVIILTIGLYLLLA